MFGIQSEFARQTSQRYDFQNLDNYAAINALRKVVFLGKAMGTL